MAQDYMTDNRTLLTVGDEKVSVAEFMRVYQKNNVQGEVIDKKSIQEYLDLYIKFKLKVKEAEDLGMDTVKAFIDELDGYRTQLTKPYFIDEDVNEALLQEAYERKLTDIRASHILIRIDENAAPEDTLKAYQQMLEIRQKALSGTDFGNLAVEFSQDPSAKDMTDPNSGNILRNGNRGDLGYFTVFDMVYPFENGAYKTYSGEISEIIRTRFGYHLIKVTDKKEAMGKATVAHIYLRFPQNANKQDSAALNEKINKAYQELVDGKDFANVVLAYSDDQGTREKGGELPPFGSNRMVPEFIFAISQLRETGDFSKPFLTQYGWHIVKLINRDTPGTFEEVKEELNKRLARDARSHKSEEAVIQKIKNDYHFKEYSKNLNALKSMIDSSLLQAKWNPDTASDMNKAVFKIGKQKFSQYELAQFISKKQKKEKPQNIQSFLDKTYKDFVVESCINYLDSRLEEIYPDFGLLMKEYRDGILLFELTDEKVWSKAVSDSTGLTVFHEANKNNYMWDTRVMVSTYTIKGLDRMEEITAKIEAGSTAKEIFRDTNTFSSDQIRMDSKIYAKGDNARIDQMEWTAGTTEVIAQNDEVVTLVIDEIIAPQPKSLNEARGLIIADYQNELEKEWVEALRGKYEVVINQKVVESIKEE